MVMDSLSLGAILNFNPLDPRAHAELLRMRRPDGEVGHHGRTDRSTGRIFVSAGRRQYRHGAGKLIGKTWTSTTVG
jgi:hypothetical protein